MKTEVRDLTTKEKLTKVVELHEKMKRAYGFVPPPDSKTRRMYELKNSNTANIIHNGENIKIVQSTTCSPNHVYYAMLVYIDGEYVKKNIRYIKTLLREYSRGC